MKILELPNNINSTNRFTAGEYPTSGFYDTSRFDTGDVKFITAVSKKKNITYFIDKGLIEDIIDTNTIEKSNTNISDILKVIAVTSNPELMKDLLNE